MTTSKKKKRLAILNKLSGKAELSNNKGVFVPTKFELTTKQRRHSGRKFPKIFGPQKILDEDGILITPYWDDWGEVRDGWRHNSDTKHFFKKWRACCFDEEEVFHINKKIKKQKAIRKLKRKHLNS